MGLRSIASTKLALAILAAVFAIEVYQAVREPISTSEAYLYDRFVRPTFRQALAQELPNHDVLYSLLEKRSVGLFHVSPLSVRVPGLLFGMLYLWSVWRFAYGLLGSGPWLAAAVTVLGALPLQWDCFSRADGVGAGLALQAWAVSLAYWHHTSNQIDKGFKLNLCGMALGLSVAARLEFGMTAVVLALVLFVVLRGRSWIDRVLIPATVSAFALLILPLSHAHARAEPIPELGGSGAAGLQSALLVLHASAGQKPIRIGAAAATEPVVNFYRAQHRLSSWGRANREFEAESCQYYVLPAADGGWAEQRHLIVLYRDGDVLLARDPAAM